MTKTKKDLVRETAKSVGVNQREALAVIDSFLNVIVSTLIANNRIELRGFGVFSTKYRKPRQARNPKTGESVNLSQRRIPIFKPSKILKQKVME